MLSEIKRLQDELNEKKDYLKQAEKSIIEFIKGKVGYVNFCNFLGNASCKI